MLSALPNIVLHLPHTLFVSPNYLLFAHYIDIRAAHSQYLLNAHSMAGLPRPAAGLPTKKHSMRPPSARPSTARPQSTAPSIQGRTQSGAISPAESVTSQSTSISRSRSPTSQLNASIKRKERDFEGDGGEETNIHVVVRCRGRNDREVRENSGVVVSTDGVKGKSVELSMGPSALSNKTYHFDKVFSPAADQAMIYDDVVTPMLEEVRAKYVAAD